jgi:hypothetical protein
MRDPSEHYPFPGILFVSRACRAEALPIFWQSIVLRMDQRYRRGSLALGCKLAMHQNVRHVAESDRPLDAERIFERIDKWKECFPRLTTYIWQPWAHGLHVSCEPSPESTSHQSQPVFKDEMARDIADPAGRSLPGFLRSEFLHQRLLRSCAGSSRQFIASSLRQDLLQNTGMRVVAPIFRGLRDKERIKKGNIDIIIDMNLLVYGVLWKVWPGVRQSDVKRREGAPVFNGPSSMSWTHYEGVSSVP